MPKIITITFNPAIDKSTKVNSLVPEKKLVCSEPYFEAGGGGVNVARALKRLGLEVTAIFPAGGHTGAFYCDLLQKENVSFTAIPIKGFTRENLIVLETSTNRQFRFGMPGPEIQNEEWENCLAAAAQSGPIDFLIISGSFAKGMGSGVFQQIKKLAVEIKAKLIVDVSGDALKEAVEAGAYLIKPNLGELASLTGKEWMDKSEAESVCKEIISRGKCTAIAVSMGAEGGMIVTEKETHNIKPPTVDRKSTVGAGDSMLAGIVFSLANGQNWHETIKYGIACGTAATMRAGTELCHQEDVMELLKRM